MKTLSARPPAWTRTLRFAPLLTLLAAILAVHSAQPVRLNDPVEGAALAEMVRTAAPTEGFAFKGVLRLNHPEQDTREIPFTSQLSLQETGWVVTYTAQLSASRSEILRIHHFTNQPSRFEFQRGGTVQDLSGGATNSFAGSDFALQDLGLEFFHWPRQLLATREMRKGRGCDVLESGASPTNLYSKVLSWIDQESRAQGQPGLLMAEAYDATGKLLKEFEIKSFKKIDGRWQVREMELRNRQTKTSTRLVFDFENK